MEIRINYVATVEYNGSMDLDPDRFLHCDTEEELIEEVVNTCIADSNLEYENWNINVDDIENLDDFIDMWTKLKDATDQSY